MQITINSPKLQVTQQKTLKREHHMSHVSYTGRRRVDGLSVAQGNTFNTFDLVLLLVVLCQNYWCSSVLQVLLTGKLIAVAKT